MSDNVTLARADFDALMDLAQRSRNVVNYLDDLLSKARPFNRYDLTSDTMNAFTAAVKGLPEIEALPLISLSEMSGAYPAIQDVIGREGSLYEIPSDPDGLPGYGRLVPVQKAKTDDIPHAKRTQPAKKRRTRKSV